MKLLIAAVLLVTVSHVLCSRSGMMGFRNRCGGCPMKAGMCGGMGMGCGYGNRRNGMGCNGNYEANHGYGNKKTCNCSTSGKTPMYKSETSVYKVESGEGPDLIGYLARPANSTGEKLPAVIVFPDWSGVDDHERITADKITKEFGYVALAADVYGNGSVGTNNEENLALLGPLMSNMELWMSRQLAAIKHVKSLEFVDPNKIAAIGYCSGGTGVLHMARFGTAINGVASFHGVLSPLPNDTLPDPLPEITAKVLVMTGYNDPSISPEQGTAFESEMTTRDADFEVISYSDTYHSFTVLGSNHTGQAVYSPRADKRSWLRTKQFFQEIFE